MRKYDKVKTIQLVIYVVLAVVGLTVIFYDRDLYHKIASDPLIKFFFGILWLLLLVSLIFIFLDFKVLLQLKKNVNELDMLVFSDPVAGIGNRYSCDAIIEKYLDKPLPEEIGCITIAITNLKEINTEFSHLAGNELIRNFSLMLLDAAEKEKKVALGRNGGNKFLVLFTDCSDQQMEHFLKNVAEKTDKFNETANFGKIEYQYGCAFHEGGNVKTINELIALSNRRSIEKYRTFVD